MSLFSIFSSRKEPALFPFRTDVHCHILPGVDDGSPDLDTSVGLVARMQRWGISRIIATPHITDTSFPNTPDTLDPALSALQARLSADGNDITLVRSSENRLDDFFIEQFQLGNITPMPDNYILVECSFIQPPWQLEQTLFDLSIKGYRPVLAHPERYFYFHNRNFSHYAKLHDSGTLFQINVLSLAEAYGKTEKKVAEGLIKRGYVDFLGTDLHNHRHADAIDRYLASSSSRSHFRDLDGHLLNDTLNF